MSIDIQKLRSGDRRQLAKAITLIESSNPVHQKEAQSLLQQLMSLTGKSFRIGITGSPGVGKSTFIEALGLHLTKLEKKVAVLAIDPSSPLTGGSILGDKTRMTNLSQAENAYIRPSPSGKYNGGIALKTREAMLICEAAGFDTIIIETVGVGQAEYEAASMVDFFQVLVLPNAGDEIQGIKKGILELANTIVINKADGKNLTDAKNAQVQYESALQILGPHEKMKVFTCSAQESMGIDEIWNYAQASYNEALKNGKLQAKRSEQNKDWMKKIVNEIIQEQLFSGDLNQKTWSQLEQKVASSQLDPYQGALSFLASVKLTLPPS